MKQCMVTAGFLFLMSACGTDNGASGSAKGIPLEGFIDALADAECAFEARCGGEYAGTSTKSRCRITRVAFHGLFFQQEFSLVQGGKLAYSANEAQKCIDNIAALPCQALKRMPKSACGLVFNGKTNTDGSCNDSLECVDGYCKKGEGKKHCPGVCQPNEKAGGTCENDSWCIGYLSCQIDYESRELGKKCSSATPTNGTPCLHSLECQQSRMYCKTEGFGKVGVCQEIPKINEACDLDSGCQKGLKCTKNTCASPAQAGEPCDGTWGGIRCGDGLMCHGEEGKASCIAQNKPGEACSTDFDCVYSDYHCGDGKCVAMPSVGEKCQANCIGLACIGPDEENKTCTGTGGNEGEPCEVGSCNLAYTCDESTRKCVDNTMACQ